MDDRCTLKQIAKAVILTAMDFDWEEYLMNHKDPSVFKSLDTFITTLYHFTSIFDLKFERISDKYYRRLSKDQFENFLALRCEMLTEKIELEYYGLILSCSFISEMVRDFRKYFHCFHYDTIAYKFLSNFLERKFKSLEQENCWNGLLDYCRYINITIAGIKFPHSPLPSIASGNSRTSDDEVFSDESDELATPRSTYFNLLTDPQHRSNIINLLKKCVTGFESASDSETTDKQTEKDIASNSTVQFKETNNNFKNNENIDNIMTDSSEENVVAKYKTKKAAVCCKKCKRGSFKYRYQKWKRAFCRHYKNWNMVTDLFNMEQSDVSTSS